MWQFGVGWDEKPPSEFLLEWSKWQKELDSLSEFLVPRFYSHVSDSPTVIQLHVFGHASEQTFCSVAYFRFRYANGSVKCAFVTAKTRVAPKTPLSIPRPELQAAVLSASLSTVIIMEHDYRIDCTYLSADSSTVFQWIRGESKYIRHEKLRHEGVEHVGNELRRQYWILRCRTAVRKMLHQCSYCKRRRVKPEPPLMAGLPTDRLQVEPAFSKVGVGFFEPLKVKYLRKQEKRHGCLFTCLVTRGVHLEVVHSLSTDSFITCLRRFIARRGKPTVIYSDNGTNFVGANHEIQECLNRWNQEKIASTLSQERIQWVISPPAAPHMRGVWERFVIYCNYCCPAESCSDG